MQRASNRPAISTDKRPHIQHTIETLTPPTSGSSSSKSFVFNTRISPSGSSTSDTGNSAVGDDTTIGTGRNVSDEDIESILSNQEARIGRMEDEICVLYNRNDQEKARREELEKKCQELEVAVRDQYQREGTIQQRCDELEESNNKWEDECARLRQEMEELRRKIPRMEYAHTEGPHSATTSCFQPINYRAPDTDGYRGHREDTWLTTEQRQVALHSGRDIRNIDRGIGGRRSVQRLPTDLSTSHHSSPPGVDQRNPQFESSLGQQPFVGGFIFRH